MPTDTLGEEVQSALRGASDYIRLKRPDDKRRRQYLSSLRSIDGRLEADIQERQTTYSEDLQAKEAARIDAIRAKLNENKRFHRVSEEQMASQQTFNSLRQVNGGSFPRNISPVLYSIPLIMIGVAEWYINFSTFSAIFIPVLAIAGTLIVAAIFAGASHLHGAYLKQLSEILHPSVDYRNELGRKIAMVMATILLIMAFLTIIWLRYGVISEQLGINPTVSVGTFGGADSGMVWSRLGPTIVLNLLIWGLGTLYAWAINEKVPGLRESYRELQRLNRKLERLRRPYEAEETRIAAQFRRDHEKNNVAIRDYVNFLEQVRGVAQQLEA